MSEKRTVLYRVNDTKHPDTRFSAIGIHGHDHKGEIGYSRVDAETYARKMAELMPGALTLGKGSVGFQEVQDHFNNPKTQREIGTEMRRGTRVLAAGVGHFFSGLVRIEAEGGAKLRLNPDLAERVTLSDLIVDEKVQGHGVGHALIHASLADFPSDIPLWINLPQHAMDQANRLDDMGFDYIETHTRSLGAVSMEEHLFVADSLGEVRDALGAGDRFLISVDERIS